MLASFIIVFREVIEAGLVVGIVLAATEGVVRRGAWVAGGALAGLGGAGLVAAFAAAISEALAGIGQQVFNAAILGAAALMLAWHSLWMASHGRQMAHDAQGVGEAVRQGERTLAAMAVVVAVAVLREGAEVVLFLFGIAASGDQPAALLAGGVGGVLAGAVLSWLIYRGLLAIPTARLFAVTNVLIAFLAAGMAGQAVVFLTRANLAPSLGDQLWDTSAVLADDTLLGKALHTLVGYSDRPMGIQVIAYVAVLAVLLGAGRISGALNAMRSQPGQPTAR